MSPSLLIIKRVSNKISKSFEFIISKSFHPTSSVGRLGCFQTLIPDYSVLPDECDFCERFSSCSILIFPRSFGSQWLRLSLYQRKTL